MPIVMPNDLDVDEMISAMKRLLQASARMYMHLTKAIITRFGREGEMTIRHGLRNYGRWRGIEMREAHHAMGLEINMKNLIGCWDNASTYLVKDEMDGGGTFLSHDARHDVSYCPAAEAWQDAEFFQWGHVYCDEFHQACASTYHPDGNVVIPRNLMKGDDHCHFQWIMPPNAQTLELGEPSELGRKLARDYQASTDIEAAWRSLKRSNRLVGGRFYTHATVILDRHGDAGAEAIREAMKNWGTERGTRLRKEHLAEGIDLSLENFIRRHDLPAKFVWNHAIVEHREGLSIEIFDTPHEEAWHDLNAVNLGAIWYEGAYEAMIRAYLPNASGKWTRLIARGDGTNRFEMVLN